MMQLLARSLEATAIAAVCALLPLAARGGDAPDEPDGLAGARKAYLSGEYEKAEKALRSLAGGGSADAGATLARLLHETGRTDAAAGIASKLAEAHPKDARFRVLLGELRLARGKTDEAEEFLIDALELDPEGPAARRARVFLKRICDVTGRVDDSEKIVTYFWGFNNRTIQAKGRLEPRDYVYVAEAVKDHDVKSRKVAFRHFMRAYRADADLHEAYLGAGALAIKVYDWMRAQRELGKLLERNPKHPGAHLGLARVYLAASEMKKAEEEAKKALEVAPGLAGAHLVLAELHLVDDRNEEARREIDAALAVNPVDPEAVALDATWRFATGDEEGFEKVAAKALAVNPLDAGVHLGAASVLERRRRFPEALARYRKALEINPDDWAGRYGVGITLVRMGEETAGYAELERAFELNPWNRWAYNTLVAMDRDIKEGALARRDTEHWVLKISKGEDPVIGEQAEEALETIWREETERFGHEPRGPDEYGRKILFEMFADHDDFSSRTAGIPNLGALGATLGQIVTMPSPSWGAGQEKPFRWTEVVRHEFAHVIVLQLTDYRVPRWFTEGVSVHVERDPQVNFDVLLARAVGEGEIAPLAELNSLFTRPETPADVALGYYQAALVVGYLVEAHGFESILKACELFRQGKDTAEAMRAVTGLPAERLDERIGRYVELHVERTRAWAPPGPKEIARLKARLAARPKDAEARSRLAEGLVASRRYDEARREAKRAIGDAGGKGAAAAHVVVGLAAKLIDRDDQAALEAFESAAVADPEHYFAELYLGLTRLGAGREDEALAALEKAHELNPRFNRPVHAFRAPPPARIVIGLLEKMDESGRLLAAAKRAATADPNDWESALAAGKALLDAGSVREALPWLERAISVNPFDAKAQLAFARASEETSRVRDRELHLAHAARAYRALTTLRNRDAGGFRGLVRALVALGRKEEARAAVEALREFDAGAADELEKTLK